MKPEPKRSVAEVHPTFDGHGRNQRPSLLIDLLTGDLGSRQHINRTPTDVPTTHGTAPPTASHSSYQSISSNNTTRTTQPSQTSTVNILTSIKRGTVENVNFRTFLIHIYLV